MPGSGLGLSRWLWVLALLLVEYLGLSLRFDALPLLQHPGLGGLLGRLGMLGPLSFVVATTTYLIAGDSLRKELAQRLASPQHSARVAPYLLLQLSSYAGLYLVTSALVERAAASGPLAWTLPIAFLVLVALTALSCVPLILPVRALLALLRRALPVVLAGTLAGALAWAMGVWSHALFPPLQRITLSLVASMLLPVFGEDLYVDESEALISAPELTVLVAPECSGFEGIGLFAVVACVYLASARGHLRLSRALWLLPIGIVTVFLSNAVRIALLMGIGITVSPEIALAGFHSKAGWVLFCAITLSLIGLAERSPYFSTQPAQAAARPGAQPQLPSPTTAHLLPLLALIAAQLVTGLFAVGLDRLYGVRIAAVILALYVYRAQLPRPSWPPSWHAPVIGVAVFGLWWALVPRPSAAALADFDAQLLELGTTQAALWLGLRALGSVLVIPLAEELAFRAFLLRRLSARDFSEVPKTRLAAWPLLASSLAFGLPHESAWLAASLAGAAYALAQSLRGRTSDAVVAHLVTNALIALSVLGFGARWLWI